MSLNSLLGAIARTSIPHLVLEEPRLDHVAVRPCAEGLRVDVGLSVLGLVQLGHVRATARFTAVLERHCPDGSTVRRAIASIESCDGAFRREGLTLAGASLLLGTPHPRRFWARIGAPGGHGVVLVDPVWTDLMVTGRAHRLVARVRGEWATPLQTERALPRI